MEDTSEKDLDFRLSKISLEFFKIHMSVSAETILSDAFSYSENV
jgi:hypothetical protein